MRTILYIGELTPDSRTTQRRRILTELGCDVTAFSSLPIEETLDGSSSLLARVSWKLGVPYDSVGINRIIQRESERLQPDVLWIEKGNTVYPWTLRAVRRTSPRTKIVSMVEDDMFAMHNRSWYFTRGIKYYTCIVTTKSFNGNPDELPALGARGVVFIDNSYDPHSHRPFDVTAAEAEVLGAGVGFIGTYEGPRAKSMQYLAENGICVKVRGNGWEKLCSKHPNLKIESHAIYGDDYAKAICATRINLCFLRKANRDRQTTRSVEIPACGGFMLAERTSEHRRLFEEGVEAAYFESDAELLDKVKYYLANEGERCAIAARGRQRCLAGKYDHHSVLGRILDTIVHIE